MHFVIRHPGLAAGVLWTAFVSAEEIQPAVPPTNLLQIQSVRVEGRAVGWPAGGELRLSPFPGNVTIAFGPASNSAWSPIRLHYKLEGYDTGWRSGAGSEMTLTIRFYNESRDIISQKVFKVEGDSPGWTGSLATSPLTHHRETVTVPRRASRCMVVISSAGPPDAVGIYVVDDFVLSEICSTNSLPQVLLQTPFARAAGTESTSESMQDWKQDGIQPGMAKIVMLGQAPQTKALAILDDDPLGHAEWRNPIEKAPPVTPGDMLVAEWNEMHSVAVANTRWASYLKLPPGQYQFRVLEETALGVPTGAEAALAIRVAVPLWEHPGFWVGVGTVLVLTSLAGARYRASYKLRRAVQRLQHQRELEQERLRLARDIHDDLGARVTEISLLSAMAPDQASFPQNARADFDRISRMSRDLIAALYGTVWAVSPENDNLYALGDYLRQMTSQLCEVAQLRCRFHIPPLPRDVQVSSQTRHNIIMAIKEAVHNVIKHANASEVTIRVAFTEGLLSVCIQDNGRGFSASVRTGGNGLANMRRRLESVGGSCVIESQSGQGTSVHLGLRIETAKSNRAGEAFA
ncbi:MAG TPA: sensor histidine kinase [Candidatus Binatia bacterium]|jgi:signal transduction histidine kinase|nr:sensor histidine kinase [Candidatus Binatia bacterium]